jgi:hypothetical protein
MAKHSSKVLELAKRGAEARLQDLIHEIKLLLEMFPHLQDAFDKDELPISFVIASGAARAKGAKASRRLTKESAMRGQGRRKAGKS